MNGRRSLVSLLLALAAAASLPAAHAQERIIVMASTTSTEQSGLFGHLLPIFKQRTGIDVRVVALGEVVEGRLELGNRRPLAPLQRIEVRVA